MNSNYPWLFPLNVSFFFLLWQDDTISPSALCGTSARRSWLFSSTSCPKRSEEEMKKKTRREKFRFVEIWYGCSQHGPRSHTASIFFGESISFPFGWCCRHRWRFRSRAIIYNYIHIFIYGANKTDRYFLACHPLFSVTLFFHRCGKQKATA